MSAISSALTHGPESVRSLTSIARAMKASQVPKPESERGQEEQAEARDPGDEIEPPARPAARWRQAVRPCSPRLTRGRPAERLAEELVLLGRPNRDADRSRRAEAAGRPHDHALASSASNSGRGIVPDLGEEEVRHRRPGRVEAVLAEDAARAARGPLRCRRAGALELGARIQARERGLLRGGGDVEGALDLADRGDDRLGRERVADAQAREPVDLRERAQHDHPPPGLQVLLDAVRVVGVVDVLEVRLVEHGQHVLGHPLEPRVELRARVRRAGRVVRVAEVRELRARADRGEHRLQVVALVAERHRRGRRRRAWSRRSRSWGRTASRRRPRRRGRARAARGSRRRRRRRSRAQPPRSGGRAVRPGPSAGGRRRRPGSGSARARPVRAPRARRARGRTGPRSTRA